MTADDLITALRGRVPDLRFTEDGHYIRFNNTYPVYAPTRDSEVEDEYVYFLCEHYGIDPRDLGLEPP